MKSALHVLQGHALAYRRTWKGTAVTTFLNPILFLAAMGMGLGTLVDRGAGPGALAGISYLEFLAPGLLAATAMQVAATDSSWPVMVGIKWRRTYEAALATPVRVRDLVAGHFGWVLVRLLLTATVFVAVMASLGASDLVRGAAAIPAAVFTGLAISGPVMAFASTQDDGPGLTAMFRFVIMPMFLFSGTFFPITQLPAALQVVAISTPLWHGVELARATALGLDAAWAPLAHIAYLAVWAAAGGWLAVLLLTRRLVR